MKLRVIITYVASGQQYHFTTEDLPIDVDGNYDAEFTFEQVCDEFLKPNSRMYIYTDLSQVLPIEFVRNHCVLSYELTR